MTDNHQQKPDMLDVAVQSLRGIPVPDGPSPELIASTLEAIQSSQPTPEQLRLQERKARMFRIARYSSLTAASIALAAVLGWLSFPGHTSNVAFGDVIQKVKEAKSVQLVTKQKLGDQPEITSVWSIQGDNLRMEIKDQMTVIVDLKKRQSLRLNPSNKTAFKLNLPKEVSKKSNNILYQLRQLRPGDAKHRDDEKIDGRKAFVYQIDDLSKTNFLDLEKAKGVMTIWVDPESKLPMKIVVQVKIIGAGKEADQGVDATLTFEDFKWNANLSASLFKMEIPDGYKEMKETRPANN